MGKIDKAVKSRPGGQRVKYDLEFYFVRYFFQNNYLFLCVHSKIFPHIDFGQIKKKKNSHFSVSFHIERNFHI